MLTTTMSLNWANTTAELVLRSGFAPDAQGCCCVCSTTHLHSLTRERGRQADQGPHAAAGLLGLRGSGGFRT